MANDEARAAATGRTVQKDSLGLPLLVGTDDESEWLTTSQFHTEPTEEVVSEVNTPPSATEQTPPGQRPVLRHHRYSGFARKKIEAKQKEAPKLAPNYVEEAHHDPIVVKGFDPDAGTELQLKDPFSKANVSAIGQQLKERDLQSPYDSSLTTSSWTNDLLTHMPKSSDDRAQQHVASLEPGEAFASQVSQYSPAFASRRLSDIDIDTPPGWLLADSPGGVSLRPRDHSSEVEVVMPSTNHPNSRLGNSSIPSDFFDPLEDPLKLNPMDGMP